MTKQPLFYNGPAIIPVRFHLVVLFDSLWFSLVLYRSCLLLCLLLLCLLLLCLLLLCLLSPLLSPLLFMHCRRIIWTKCAQNWSSFVEFPPQMNSCLIASTDPVLFAVTSIK